MIKVLMIEDDIELAEILTEYLEQFDIEVTNVENPYIGMSKLNIENFDLVILDLTLPEIDGLEVCSEIRKKHDIPIIISSARHDINDKVEALEKRGADDYLPKPYNPRELQARIKSLLRRKEPKAKKSKKEIAIYLILLLNIFMKICFFKIQMIKIKYKPVKAQAKCVSLSMYL